MDFREVFEAELMANNIDLCRGCDHGRGHKRGFVLRGERVVHLDRAIATRSTLHRALHEVGHVLNAEAEKAQKSWEREAGAEKYATDTMRVLGISVPRKVVAAGVAYVARKKRHGANIRAAIRKAEGEHD
jgi:hypothetical protein